MRPSTGNAWITTTGPAEGDQAVSPRQGIICQEHSGLGSTPLKDIFRDVTPTTLMQKVDPEADQ